MNTAHYQIIVVLIVLCSALTVMSVPLTNITIEGPDGISNHGVPDMLCVPIKWTDIVLFFLGNYVAHAATIKAYPGESSQTMAVCLVFALLFPISGSMRGLTSIVRCSAFIKDPLRKAARSGALCMIVRSPDWEPRPGDKLRAGIGTHPLKFNCFGQLASFHWDDVDTIIPVSRNEIPVVMTCVPNYARDSSKYWTYTDTKNFYVNDRKIYGSFELPPGYEIAHVPQDSVISPLRDSSSPELPSTHSATRAIVALLQSLYASFTLFQTRGDQIRQYGYAAFGFTVTPYAVMSALNIFSNILTPDYATMYLIRSEVMDEAIGRGGKFNYVVGEITSISDSDAIPGTFVDVSGTFEAVHNDPGTLRLHLDSTMLLSPDSSIPFLRVEHGTPLEVKAKPSYDVSTEYRPVVVAACPKFQKETHHKYIHMLAGAAMPMPVQMLILIIFQALPFMIIGGLSRFHDGKSTLSQRVWTTMWLVFGSSYGAVAAFLPYELPTATRTGNRLVDFANRLMGVDLTQTDGSRKSITKYTPKLNTMTRLIIVVALVYSAPAFGGFVIVGKMLREYGNCIHF